MYRCTGLRSNRFTHVGNSEGKCYPAVHGQYGLDVVDQLRFHFFCRAFQSSALSQHNLHSDSESHQRHRKRHGQGDRDLADYHDSELGEDAAGEDAAIYRQHAGDVDGEMRHDQCERALHGKRRGGDKLHH